MLILNSLCLVLRCWIVDWTCCDTCGCCRPCPWIRSLWKLLRNVPFRWKQCYRIPEDSQKGGFGDLPGWGVFCGVNHLSGGKRQGCDACLGRCFVPRGNPVCGCIRVRSGIKQQMVILMSRHEPHSHRNGKKDKEYPRLKQTPLIWRIQIPSKQQGISV